MGRFGVLLASAALGAALAASGPALAFHGGGGGFRGGGFGGGGFHGGGFDGFRGPMFAGRSVAMGRFNRGFGINRGFDHRRFDHFHHFDRFHRFRNRFVFAPFFWNYGWDYGYPSTDCSYWDSDDCGNGYPDYASEYGYPTTGSNGYYAAAPLATGRSVATGQLGSYCTISVKSCLLHHSSGDACSCQMPGGRVGGVVTH